MDCLHNKVDGNEITKKGESSDHQGSSSEVVECS